MRCKYICAPSRKLVTNDSQMKERKATCNCDNDYLECTDTDLVNAEHEQCPKCSSDADCAGNDICGIEFGAPICGMCWDAGYEKGASVCVEENPISPSAEPSAECFPSTAQVMLDDGTMKAMSELELGDRVQVSSNSFSEVFLFTHKVSTTVSDFVRIHTATGCALSLTKGHYMYVNGKMKPAASIQVGDNVQCNDSLDTISKLSIVRERGLYNPQTLNGDIIVNGVKASTYTVVTEPNAAQAILTPFRLAYCILGFTTNVFNKGSEMLARTASWIFT